MISVACLNEGAEFPRLQANSVLLRDHGLAAIVDCGGRRDRDTILNGLAARGVQQSHVNLVIVTHLHFDHCENIDLFDKAEVVVHRDEFEFLERLLCESTPEKARAFLLSTYECLPAFYLRTILRRLDECRSEYTRLVSDRGRLCLIDSNRSTIDGLDIIKTSGHSIGHVSVGVRGIHPVWIAGDAVVSSRAWNAEVPWEQQLCWSVRESVRSRSLIAEWDGVLVPGHGVPFATQTGSQVSFLQLE